ncbi:MAG: hypothetical protein HY644_13460 [Acidobacteria bacterium]|nr:hypothetical protein [Acidobacteriota bacterium]
MPPLVVQTGSVPALLYLLQRCVPHGPVRILALDCENVRQYLRGLDNVELRFFRHSQDAQAAMDDWSDSENVYYIGGAAFPFVQKKVRRVFPQATSLLPEQQENWPEFLEHFQSEIRRDAVLLVQTESAEFIGEYLHQIFPRYGFTRPSLSLLCPHKDLAGWRRAHPDWQYWTYRTPSELLPLAVAVRRQQFDACVIFFTGKGSSTLKFLALLGAARQKIIVNEHMQFIQARPLSLLRFGLQRWRHGVHVQGAYPSGTTRVLIVQTWDDDRMKAMLMRLRQSSPFFRPVYSLLTRADKAIAFAPLPVLEKIFTYPIDAGLHDYRRTFRTIRNERFDAAVVIFTEEPSFRKLKWLPLLAGIRYKLIFNRHYDCFFLTPGKLIHYWIRLGQSRVQRLQHAILARCRQDRNRVLIVQTCDETRMKEICRRLEQIRTFYHPTYWLLTRADKAVTFSDVSLIEEILTYPVNPGLRDYWHTLREIRKKHFDAAVVAFTEEAIYGKLKWLPFLAAVPHKLVFNRHLDCFFFTPVRFLRYWMQRYADEVRDFRVALPQLLWPLALPLVRAFLFPFRFFYLVIKITWMKVRRAYSLDS